MKKILVLACVCTLSAMFLADAAGSEPRQPIQARRVIRTPLKPQTASMRTPRPPRTAAPQAAVKSLPAPPPAAPPAAESNVQMGQRMAAARGWVGEQWTALYELWMAESGWKTNASNPRGTAWGIPQALPGSKMASHGADWRTNPATQISWGLAYIAARYGSPVAAWGHFQRRNWY